MRRIEVRMAFLFHNLELGPSSSGRLTIREDVVGVYELRDHWRVHLSDHCKNGWLISGDMRAEPVAFHLQRGWSMGMNARVQQRT